MMRTRSSIAAPTDIDYATAITPGIVDAARIRSNARPINVETSCVRITPLECGVREHGVVIRTPKTDVLNANDVGTREPAQ